VDSTTALRLSVSSPDSEVGADAGEAQTGRLRMLVSVASRLAAPGEREAAIHALAHTLGTDTVVLFVRDPEIGMLLPAPGFPQTLPAGKRWQAFLAECTKHGAHAGELPFPDAATQVPAAGVATGEEAALVLLGGSPDRGLLAEVGLLLPLLAFAFRGERALHVADAQAAAARRAAEESRALATILDGARADLQGALAEAHEQRARVKRQAAELEAVFQALPGAVVMCDADGRLVHINAHAEALFRAALGRVPRTLAESEEAAWLLSSDGRPMALDATPLAQALQGASRGDVRCVLRRADTGEEIQLLVSAEPMRDEAGHVVGAVSIAADITRLHQLEREKDEFLSIASHELRTPVTTMLANSQLAQRRIRRLVAKATATGSDLITDLQVLQRMLAGSVAAAERQRRLADDLLDVSRLAVGKLEYRPEPRDLTAIVREYVEELCAAHPSRDIRLELPSGSIEVMADADRIGQVVTNYVSNALKYCPIEDPITVCLRADAGTARVEVRDQGPGLPPEEHERIWERFHRAEGIAHRNGSGVGLGLGLYICKTIVERHGGRVGVESASGAGSAFWFELPLVPLHPAATLPDAG
jgi:signal transduction histidine kinase